MNVRRADVWAVFAACGVCAMAHAQCGSVTWTRSANAPYRTGHGLAYDSTRMRTIMFGGAILFTGQQFGNQTWSYSGGTWTQLFPATSPPGRQQQGNLTYDSARDRVVLYGGFSSPQLFDTWEFDGTNWLQRTIDGPRVTDGFVMAYDAARQRVVLFGGQPEDFQQPYSSQTWLWNGTAWTLATPAISPPGLRYASMVYDSARQRVVLFGGQRSNFTESNETWEWDGTNWSQRATTGPTGGLNLPMAYDSARQRAVLAYRINPQPFTTWEWNGTTWTQSSQPATNTCGPGLTGAAMVFDSSIGQCVMTQHTQQQSTVTQHFGPLSLPPFTQQPVGGVIPPGGQINLSADTGCVEGRTYRWRHNNTPLADFMLPGGTGGVLGSTGPALTIYGQAVTASRTGSYDCVVTTSCGTTTSQAASISVSCNPNEVTYQIDPAVCQFILTAFDGTELANAVATLLGSMTVRFDPSCGSSPTGTRGQIRSIDWHTQQGTVPMVWAGGTASLNNLHAVVSDTRGVRPAPTVISGNSFSQTAQLAFDGTLTYNAFNLNSSLNLSTAPPLTVVATASVSGGTAPNLTIPFDDDYEVDAGLGPLNPRLRLITTIRAEAPTCAADVDDGTGSGTRDDAVTVDDLLFYLALFEAGDPRGDVDNGTLTGVRDQAVTIDDLLYYLIRFEAGC